MMSLCHITGGDISLDHLVKVVLAAFFQCDVFIFPFQLINIMEGDSLRVPYFSLYLAHSFLASIDCSCLPHYYYAICLMMICYFPHLYELIFSNLLGCSGS